MRSRLVLMAAVLAVGCDSSTRSTGPSSEIRGDAVTETERTDPLNVTDCAECPTLLFVRSRHIFRTTAGGQEALLTEGGHPAWSPDGTRIAFSRQVPDEGRIDVFLMDADGSNVVRRTWSGGVAPFDPWWQRPRWSPAGFHQPAWSPDGTKLAVATGGVYEGSVYVLGVDDGSEPRELTDMATQPAWSPDGSQIVFVSLSGDDGYHALHVMNADGSDIRVVVARDEGGIERPTWLPDGESLGFSKCIRGRCDLYSVAVDGSNLAQITHGVLAHGAAWSPDGAWIAFIDDYRRPSITVVRTAEPEGPFTVVAADAYYPAWRP